MRELFSVRSNVGLPALQSVRSEIASIVGESLYSIKIESEATQSSPKEICEKFAEIIIVHLEQQFNNEIQNTVLTNLKKTLQKELVLGKLKFTYNKIT